MTTALPALKTDPRQTRIRDLLEHPRYQESLKAILPRDVTPQRIVRVTLAALQNQPKLLQCSPQSIILALMQAAVCGLEPDGGPLAHGYLVPFWNPKDKRLDAKFIAGYRGLVRMARNSGEVADVWAEVVRQGDSFTYSLGLRPDLAHTRNDSAAKPGALHYAYAVARFRDGERKFVVMNRAEIDEIKALSPSRDKDGNLVGPWIDHEPEMWKKTVVRRLCKMLPLSADTHRHLAAIDETAPTPASTVADLPLPSLEFDEPSAIDADHETVTTEAAPLEPVAADTAQAGLVAELDQAQTIGAARKIGERYLDQATDDDQRRAIAQAVAARETAIRSHRGSRSNEPDLKT